MRKIVITESQFKRLIENDELVISPKVVKRWEKFNNELIAFYEESNTDCIYEDAFTPRYVSDFHMNPNGTLIYIEDGKQQSEYLYFDDYALDWLKDFKAWLRKAKKYWAMNAETLDDIHDGNAEDLAESKLVTESSTLIEDELEDYSVFELLQEWLNDKNNGINKKQWDVIPKTPYWNALRNYMQYGESFRTPESLIDEWLKKIIHNTYCLSLITDIAGHSLSFPEDELRDFFFYENESATPSDYHEWCDFLDEQGFYDWTFMPDGSEAWSDFGLTPLNKILSELTDNSSKGEKLIIINRCLNVAHMRGDLASIFIEGGSASCYDISNN